MSLGVPASYCQSTVNSTGQPATIDSVGSHLVAVDDFTLLARPVPDGTGFFLASGQTTQVPRWDGFLCVASPLARTPVLDARGGELFGRVELAALPFTVLPGSTWHFQAWFEDPAAGGTGANLSNGVSVTFCP